MTTYSSGLRTVLRTFGASDTSYLVSSFQTDLDDVAPCTKVLLGADEGLGITMSALDAIAPGRMNILLPITADPLHSFAFEKQLVSFEVHFNSLHWNELNIK